MRRLIVIGVLAICAALLTGVVANGRTFIRAGGWTSGIYFGPNSSYVPSLNIDFKSHQAFDVTFENVSPRSIGMIHASIKLHCQGPSGPLPTPAPAQATNRPSPLAPALPVRFRPDGSFSLVMQERWNPQIPATESTFRISGRFHGRTASGTLSYDFNQPLATGSPSQTTTTAATTPSGLDCHSGPVTWHATWQNHAPSSG
jgi:hypothetical protein